MPNIDPITRRTIAVKHMIDERQIKRFLKGETQKPLTVARVRAALLAEGLLPAEGQAA